ncbi:hypothetical protein [Profundibacter amoris]|uniref:Uncharacterized protein n=1 Tax=Profundibacter amoris TaxID=2171755 RepID=A0A347UGX8_9RHOB|nr:hypothetical protein [Profundibacter amoris]AXX98106.1 hypothetical protein BAR1_09285 [Profundibacter amoris]
MGIVEDLADELAKEALKAVDEHEDDMIIERVAEILGADSITTQEAFMTAIRVRKADRRARVYLSKLNKTKA